ncbi:MAG TPA: hypothetical protein VKZ49_18750 [Polyangiaceae bacterium]|nr:hypothetical protein [Polyangiaceae bacterium]
MGPEHQRSARLEFERAGRPRALLLSAIVVLVFALLPLLGDGPLTATRIGTALALLAAAGALVAYSRPRRRGLCVDLEAERVDAEGRSFSLADVRAVVLTGSGDALDPSPRPQYRAALLLASGRQLVLAEAPEPSEVLSQVGRLLRVVKLPVKPGWGIPPNATPWLEPRSASADGSGPAALNLDLACEALPSQRASGKAVLIGAAGASLLMLAVFGARVAKDLSISATSVGLSVLTVGVLLLIAAAQLTDTVRVRTNGRLVVERSVLGWRRERRDFDRRSLLGIFVVGPDPAVVRHVLLQTDDGLISLPCAGEGARELGRTLQGSTRSSP